MSLVYLIAIASTAKLSSNDFHKKGIDIEICLPLARFYTEILKSARDWALAAHNFFSKPLEKLIKILKIYLRSVTSEQNLIQT